MKMKAKEYLQQIELLDEMIDEKQNEYDSMRILLSSPGGIDYSQEKVQTSPQDSMSKIVSRYIDLQAEINADIDYFADVKDKVINQIHGLRDIRYVKLLHKKYIKYKSLELIAVEMRYNYDYMRELHGYALQAFERKYPDLRKFPTRSHKKV